MKQKLQPVEGATLRNDNLGSNDFTSWQRTFERYNIDTTDFMAADYYRYYYTNNEYYTEKYYIYVFKFASPAANNCYENFDFSEYHSSNTNIEYATRIYGNLVVSVSSEIAEWAYNIIDDVNDNL